MQDFSCTLDDYSAGKRKIFPAFMEHNFIIVLKRLSVDLRNIYSQFFGVLVITLRI